MDLKAEQKAIRKQAVLAFALCLAISTACVLYYRCCICVKFYRFYAPELPDGVSKKRRAEIKQWSCDEAENQDAIKWL